MPFGVAKNGMRMYVPTWQLQPGASMKSMNRSSWESYNSNFSSLNSNLLAATPNQSAGMIEITSKIVTTRLQEQFSKKLAQAKAGLDVEI